MISSIFLLNIEASSLGSVFAPALSILISRMLILFLNVNIKLLIIRRATRETDKMIPYTAKVEIDQSLAILSTNCLTESLFIKQTEKAVILATNRSNKNCLMRPTF